jgi:hypothetical protein
MLQHEQLTYPPNYDAIVAAIPTVKGRHGVIFTYGDTIYNPSRIVVSPDLYAHEAVHTVQQMRDGMTPEKWWDRYLADITFRYEQEVEAYRAQYQYAVDHYGRDERRQLLKHIEKTLAGPLYGRLTSPQRVRAMMKGEPAMAVPR